MSQFHVPAKIAKAFDGTKKLIRLATRLTMEDVFKEWRKRFAPKHFMKQAFAQYKAYIGSYKRTYHPGQRQVRNSHKILDWRIRKNQDTPLPLVKTGAGRQAFLTGPVRFRGSHQRLSAVFEGLPRYMYQYAAGTLNKHDALTEVAPAESLSLANYAATRMTFHMNRKRIRGISAGRITI